MWIIYREQAVVTESLRTEVRDALILQDRNGLTGMHLALMDGKHERALMLLKVSKCMYGHYNKPLRNVDLLIFIAV